jgi:hypothetical protein
LDFEIRTITYSDEFTKAKAMIAVDMYVNLPNFQGKPMKVPFMTWWKVIDGQWYWYVEPQDGSMTPFGKMKTGPPTKDGGVPVPPPDVTKAVDIRALQKRVVADRRIVQLKGTEVSSDQVTISNQFTGTVTLQMQEIEFPGLTMKLDRTELKAGEKAVLSFHFEPDQNVPRHPLLASVMVQPINSAITIRVVFQ